MTIDQLKYEIIIDFFYFLLTLFTGGTRLYNLQFRFLQFYNFQINILVFLSRFPYRLYYCLKEFEDQTLIKFNPIAQHILNINSSYTIFSTMLTENIISIFIKKNSTFYFL